MQIKESRYQARSQPPLHALAHTRTHAHTHTNAQCTYAQWLGFPTWLFKSCSNCIQENVEPFAVGPGYSDILESLFGPVFGSTTGIAFQDVFCRSLLNL